MGLFRGRAATARGPSNMIGYMAGGDPTNLGNVMYKKDIIQGRKNAKQMRSDIDHLTKQQKNLQKAVGVRPGSDAPIPKGKIASKIGVNPFTLENLNFTQVIIPEGKSNIEFAKKYSR